MLKKSIIFVLTLGVLGCIVVPEVENSREYHCSLSADKKTLKVINLMKGDTSFYAWDDEFLSIITMPTSAIASSVYVAVNNVYYFGEKRMKCSNKKQPVNNND